MLQTLRNKPITSEYGFETYFRKLPVGKGEGRFSPGGLHILNGPVPDMAVHKKEVHRCALSVAGRDPGDRAVVKAESAIHTYCHRRRGDGEQAASFVDAPDLELKKGVPFEIA